MHRRSPGPSPMHSVTKNPLLRMLRCERAAPFGEPVVPEVYWMRHSGDYGAAARGFSSGTTDGLTAWLLMSSRALHAGAREALSIAQAAST